MIRLANDVNGFHDGQNKNIMYLSSTKYPKQNSDYIGKWTALRYKSEYYDIPPYVYYTDGKIKVFKRNGEYYYDESTKKKVPEKDINGDDIIITEILENHSINNRHVIDRRYFPTVTINNSGTTTLFQILRYDLEAPFKVILRSKDNEVIVISTEDFEKIYDLEDSDMLKRVNNIASANQVEYISPKTTDDSDTFFNFYNNEKVNVYPIQNDEILGINVYTEYESDLYDKNLSFADNKMNKYGPVDNEGNRVVEEDGTYKYLDNLNDEVPEENLPIGEDYINRFRFTDRMAKNLIKSDNKLKGYPNTTLQSFKHTYDVHLRYTTIDTPRRAINKGVIIRADINTAEPYLVVLEYTEDDSLRVVCSDEARFFYNSEDMYKLISKDDITEIINSHDLVK